MFTKARADRDRPLNDEIQRGVDFERERDAAVNTAVVRFRGCLIRMWHDVSFTWRLLSNSVNNGLRGFMGQFGEKGFMPR